MKCSCIDPIRGNQSQQQKQEAATWRRNMFMQMIDRYLVKLWKFSKQKLWINVLRDKDRLLFPSCIVLSTLNVLFYVPKMPNVILTFWIINVIRSRTFQPAVCLVCEQEAAAPACGGEGSVAGGELPPQTPASKRSVSESRVPDALPADRTGTLMHTVSFILHVNKLSDVSENAAEIFPPWSFCRTQKKTLAFFWGGGE